MYRNNSRRVWNGLIDKKPAVIVEARTYADVGHIVRLCHKFRVPLTVRGVYIYNFCGVLLRIIPSRIFSVRYCDVYCTLLWVFFTFWVGG